jgi:hypothetical protein
VRLSQRVCLKAREGGAEREAAGADVASSSVWLRVAVAPGGRCHFSYSLDGARFLDIGETFTARPGLWVGAKVGLFAAASEAARETGYADFDWFRVTATP